MSPDHVFETKMFVGRDLWQPRRQPMQAQDGRYQPPPPTGIAAPWPQLAQLIKPKQPLPLLIFIKLQRRLMSAKPRHRPIYLHGEQVAWSKGRLVAVRPQDGRLRELTDKELSLVRRIELPITGYVDGQTALENCEMLLAELTPELPTVVVKLETPSQQRPLPKNASAMRQPGAKRRWFPEGNIVALRQSEVGFILVAIHGEPIAFESKDRARRHYGPRRLARRELQREDLVIARVIRRFHADLVCSPEFEHLGPEGMVEQGFAQPELKVRYMPKLCLLKDGTWGLELHDLKNLRRRVLKRPSTFNSELLRPLRELADQITATGRRMDEISLLVEEIVRAFGKGGGGRRKLRSLTREQERLAANLDVPGCERAIRLLPPSILRSMGISGPLGLPTDLRENYMVPNPGPGFFIRVPYERVFEGKSETRTMELELSPDHAAMLHGREFWLVQETTPQTQTLDKDPLSRIVLPLSWEEALDQDGVLARAV